MKERGFFWGAVLRLLGCLRAARVSSQSPVPRAAVAKMSAGAGAADLCSGMASELSPRRYLVTFVPDLSVCHHVNAACPQLGLC